MVMRNLDLMDFVEEKAIKKYNLDNYCSRNYRQGWLSEAVYIADADIYYNEETRLFGYTWIHGTGSTDECFEVIDYEKGIVIERFYFDDFEKEFGYKYLY